MKKQSPDHSSPDQTAPLKTVALTPEQVAGMAIAIFHGNGRQAGRAGEHWPEAEVRLLCGAPANRRAL